MHLFNQKYSKQYYCEILQLKIFKMTFIFEYFEMSFIPVMQIWIYFSIITSVSQDPSEIIQICWFFMYTLYNYII